MMQATTLPSSPPASNSTRPTSPYYRGGGGGSHRRRSWSEENTIREETTDEETTQFLNHPASRNASSFSAYDTTKTTTIGGFQVQRTAPFYMFLLLLVTVPMFFVSLLSTSRVPHPRSLDHDPRYIEHLLTNVPESKAKDNNANMHNPQRSLQSRYQGRTYHEMSHDHATYDQVTTLFESVSAKCSVATMTQSSSSKTDQSLLVSQLDQVLVTVLDTKGGEWIIPSEPSNTEEQPHSFVWQGAVQDLHEPPLAAAMRITNATLSKNPNNQIPEIALDAHGWPLGHVPETLGHEWTFLGRTQLPDRLAFAYLYRPGSNNIHLHHHHNKRQSHANVVQEWQRGTMVSVTHSWAMSLALFGPKAPLSPNGEARISSPENIQT